MADIILVGGGGHCRSCIEVLENSGYTIKGILEKSRSSETVLGYPVIGDDEDLHDLISQGYEFLITIGQVKNAMPRIRLFERIKELNGRLATVIASSASVSRHAFVKEGSFVMQHAIVNAAASVGSNCIINNKALVEHDCSIGDHTHISTGAIVNGGCEVGQRCFLGSNAVVAQEIKIADDVIIGAGSVVTHNITEPGIYAGNPLRKIN
jgi:sugar O-acyltransferase (sialic acid O-acetyltransferase NeuD family)